MDRAAVWRAELQILGTFCNQAGTIEQRNELAQILDHYAFVEPEHQILFGSIRSLLVHDRLSTASLAVHLNNRGFPDVDLEKYCAAGLADVDAAVNLARRLSSLTNGIAEDVHYDTKGKVKHEI